MLSEKQLIKLRKKYPNGRVKASKFSSALAAIFILVFGSIFISAGVFVVLKVPQILKFELNLEKVFFLFPAVGILVATTGIIGLCRVIRFRRSRFDIAAVPTPIGRNLKGRLYLPTGKIPAGTTVKITLINEEKYRTRSGGKTCIYTTTLSRKRIEVPIGHFVEDYSNHGMLAYDVDIVISPHGKDSTDNYGSHKIRWYLKAEAAIPGFNLSQDFTLPIFRTIETPSVEDENTSHVVQAIDYSDVQASQVLSESASVSVQNEGATQKYHSGGFKPGLFMFGLFFALFFCGVSIFIGISKYKDFSDSSGSLEFRLIVDICCTIVGVLIGLGFFALILYLMGKRVSYVQDNSVIVEFSSIFGRKRYEIEAGYIFDIQIYNSGSMNDKLFFKVFLLHSDYSKMSWFEKFIHSKCSPDKLPQLELIIASNVESRSEASAIVKKFKDSLTIKTPA